MSLPLASLVRSIIHNLSRSGRRKSHTEKKGPTAAAVLEVRQVPSATSLGVIDGNTLKLDAQRANDPAGANGATEMDFSFGLPGDKILVGNWNGPGQGTTPVVVRQPGQNGAPNDGLVHWYFDTNGDATVDNHLAFGLGGDNPVVGDWDGDGKDDIGVTRKSGGIGMANDGLLNWFLRAPNNPNGFVARKYGFSSDTPVVGNWDGVAGDDLGITRVDAQGRMMWMQDWTGDAYPERIFEFGKRGDTPVTGDWDANGTDNVGVTRDFGGASLNWLLDTNNNSASEISRILNYAAGTTPIVGDWKVAEVEVDGITDGQTQPMNIGIAAVGSSTTREFTVRNTGTRTLNLGTPTLTAGFTLEKGLPSTLAPGASDTFRIRFSPTTEGTTPGTVQFTTNDGNELIFDFSIHGSTPAPEINIVGIGDGQLTAIDFGSVLVNSTQPTKTFRIENLGTAPLTLGQPQLPAGFRLVQPFTTTSLNPKQSLDLVIAMDTSVVKAQQGQVVIPNNDANENPYNFTIKGVVTSRVPEIVVTSVTNGVDVTDGQPTAISFGNLVRGAAGTLRTFEIENKGSAPLTLSAVTISNRNFTVTQQPASVVAPYSKTSFTIRLESQYAGSKTAMVNFTSNDADETDFNFPIAGVVEQPFAEITVDGIQSGQTSVNFGSVPQNSTPLTKTFTIRNDGNIPLILGSVSVTGGSYFSVVSQPASTVAPGGTTTFTIRMSTSNPTLSNSATVSFTTNDPNESPFTFGVYGVVVPSPPEIEVRINGAVLAEGVVGQLDMGALFRDSATETRTIEVRNRGNSPLILSNPIVTGGFSVNGPWGQSIAANASVNITVSMSPGVAGIKQGSLQFSTNDRTGNESTIGINLNGKVFGGQLSTYLGSVLNWSAVTNRDGRVMVLKQVQTYGGTGNRVRLFASFYGADLQQASVTALPIGDHANYGDQITPKAVAMTNGNFAIAWVLKNSLVTGGVHYMIATPVGQIYGITDRIANSIYSSKLNVISMAATSSGFSIDWQDTSTLKAWRGTFGSNGVRLSVSEI